MVPSGHHAAEPLTLLHNAMPRALLPFAFACCLAQSVTNEALHRRGLDYGYNLDYPEALAAFDAAIAADPARHPSDAQTTAMLTLMLILNREGRYGEALGIARELQRRYPRNRLFWLEAGNTALRAGRAAVALDELNEGFARFQKDPRPKATGEEAQWQAARDRALKLLPASQH
jgi:tetratricopeptide (TPR) repeat protein